MSLENAELFAEFNKWNTARIANKRKREKEAMRTSAQNSKSETEGDIPVEDVDDNKDNEDLETFPDTVDAISDIERETAELEDKSESDSAPEDTPEVDGTQDDLGEEQSIREEEAAGRPPEKEKKPPAAAYTDVRSKAAQSAANELEVEWAQPGMRAAIQAALEAANFDVGKVFNESGKVKPGYASVLYKHMQALPKKGKEGWAVHGASVLASNKLKESAVKARNPETGGFFYRPGSSGQVRWYGYGYEDPNRANIGEKQMNEYLKEATPEDQRALAQRYFAGGGQLDTAQAKAWANADATMKEDARIALQRWHRTYMPQGVDDDFSNGLRTRFDGAGTVGETMRGLVTAADGPNAQPAPTTSMTPGATLVPGRPGVFETPQELANRVGSVGFPSTASPAAPLTPLEMRSKAKAARVLATGGTPGQDTATGKPVYNTTPRYYMTPKRQAQETRRQQAGAQARMRARFMAAQATMPSGPRDATGSRVRPGFAATEASMKNYPKARPGLRPASLIQKQRPIEKSDGSVPEAGRLPNTPAHGEAAEAIVKKNPGTAGRERDKPVVYGGPQDG